MSTGKDVFKHAKGNFDRLTNKNYTTWSENMRRLLQAIDAWDIVNGDEDSPEKPAVGAPKDVRDEFKDYRNRYRDASVCIYNACSEPVRVYIKKIDNPEDMWDELMDKMNTANTATGRQQIYREFTSLRPVPGAPIGEYFAKLSDLRMQIAGTDEEISDTAFKTHLFDTLPKVFEMTAKFQQNRVGATIDEIMEALLEDERVRTMRNQTDAAADALASNATAVTKKGRKHCDFCNTNTHPTERCWSKNNKKKNRKNSNGKRDKSDSDDDDDSDFCFHCGEPGHRSPQCPVKKKAADARQKKKKGADDKDAGSGF
jgi:hypothetical protein